MRSLLHCSQSGPRVAHLQPAATQVARRKPDTSQEESARLAGVAAATVGSPAPKALEKRQSEMCGADSHRFRLHFIATGHRRETSAAYCPGGFML